jgi:hypothetical protein
VLLFQRTALVGGKSVPSAKLIPILAVLCLACILAAGAAAVSAQPGASTVGPEGGAGGTGAVHQDPRGDTGDRGDVNDVKKAVPVLLTADVAVQRMTPAQKADAGLRKSAKFADRLTAGLEAVWSGDTEDDEIASNRAALAASEGDTAYIPFQDNTFVVTTWQGVAVDGDTAIAIVVAHQTFEKAGSWYPDRDGQHQIGLVRDDGNPTGWALAWHVEVALGGSG